MGSSFNNTAQHLELTYLEEGLYATRLAQLTFLVNFDQEMPPHFEAHISRLISDIDRGLFNNEGLMQQTEEEDYDTKPSKQQIDI